MKNCLLLIGIVVVSTFILAYKSSPGNSLAKVNSYKGKLLFICCEPVKSYTVAEDDFNFFVWRIKDVASFYERAIDIAIDNGVEFDAIKVESNGDFQLIKFIE